MLEYYLKLEKLRARNSFDYNIEMDQSIKAEINELKIPPFLLQPFVENAILHGLMPLEGKKGLLKIFISKINSEKIQITMEDNGIGRQQSALRKQMDHTSLASSLVQKRIDLFKQMLQKEISIDIVDLYNDTVSLGTKVIISIAF